MCTVTATEFKEQFGKYLKLGTKEDILITKNGKPLVKLVSVNGSSIWGSFFDEYEGSMDENDVDLSDPIAAGIVGKLWDF